MPTIKKYTLAVFFSGLLGESLLVFSLARYFLNSEIKRLRNCCEIAQPATNTMLIFIGPTGRVFFPLLFAGLFYWLKGKRARRDKWIALLAGALIYGAAYIPGDRVMQMNSTDYAAGRCGEPHAMTQQVARFDCSAPVGRSQ